jgi:PAS domain S-box-containing protein
MPSDSLRSALDNLLVGFQIIGFDWHYRYVNPAAANHGRRRPEELVGKRMWDVYPGIEQTPMFAMLRRAMADRTNHVMDNLFTYPNGEERWFEVRVQAVPEGICVYSADIHERKVAELESEQRLTALEERASVLARMWKALTGKEPESSG